MFLADIFEFDQAAVIRNTLVDILTALRSHKAESIKLDTIFQEMAQRGYPITREYIQGLLNMNKELGSIHGDHFVTIPLGKSADKANKKPPPDGKEVVSKLAASQRKKNKLTEAPMSSWFKNINGI